MKKLLILLPLVLCLFSCGEKRYSTQYWGMFDTVVDVEGYFESEEEFKRADKLIYDTLSYYNSLFNIYEDAQFTNLKSVNESGGVPIQVDRELYDFIAYLKNADNMTGGACNAALGRVSMLWKKALEEKTLPDEALLEEASRHCDFDTVELDPTNLKITLTDPKLRIDAGAVAKGYVSQKLISVLSENGIDNVLINLGGNVVAIGSKNGEKWRVGIKNPSGDGNSAIVEISDTSLVTSGGYERGAEINTSWYHHIINPETLSPASNHLSVSVLSGDPALADVLSTALFVLPLEEGLKLVEETQAEAMWIGLGGEITKSENFN